MRKILIALALACLSIFCHAQDGSENGLGKYIELSIDRPDGQYAAGEVVNVYARVDSLAYDMVNMSVSINGIRGQSGPLALKEGRQLIFSGSYSESTAVMVSLSDPASPRTRLDIGFVVEPLGFRPGYAAPGDLRKYWKKEFKALKKDKMQVKMTPVALSGSDAEEYECWDVELSCPGGAPVRGYLARPKNAARGTLPAVLQSCAAGVAGSWCRATVRETLSMAKWGNGAMVFFINAHGMYNDREEQYYKDLENGPLKDYSVRSVTTKEDYYFRAMFLRMERAVDFLCSDKMWDGKRLMVVGESQGGAQAAAIAGLDPRVSAAVLKVPAMIDMGGYKAGRASGWPQPAEKEPSNPAIDEVIPYFDAALLMKGCEAKMFVEIGLIDTTCPASAVLAGVNNTAGNVIVSTFPRRPHHEPSDPKIKRVWRENVYEERMKFINGYLK